jgi:dTDP-4-amino-4,6-dideoxygalactose transaminase
MSRPIPHSLPCLGEAEAAAAAAVVLSGWVKGGAERQALELTLARDQGFAHALATPSATQAIHLALRARFPGGGARVALPAYLCRSVWDAVGLANCQPVLVDNDADTLGPSLPATKAVRPAAVIVPHLAGVRAPVEAFLREDWFVIEDCAQRIERHPTPPPPAAHHARVFSFEATKVLTCGEGGALLLADPELHTRARRLRDGDATGREPGLWLPITDVQAAVARVQWERLAELTQRRCQQIDRLKALIPSAAWHPAMHGPLAAPFRFLIEVPNAADWVTHPTVSYRRPVGHGSLADLLPGPHAGPFPAADRLARRLLSVPCSPALSAEEIETVGRTTCERLLDSPTGALA